MRFVIKRFVGPRLVEELRELFSELSQRVASRRILLQVGKGEGVERFVAKRLFDDGKFLAQTFQQATT